MFLPRLIPMITALGMAAQAAVAQLDFEKLCSDVSEIELDGKLVTLPEGGGKSEEFRIEMKISKGRRLDELVNVMKGIRLYPESIQLSPPYKFTSTSICKIHLKRGQKTEELIMISSVSFVYEKRAYTSNNLLQMRELTKLLKKWSDEDMRKEE